MPKLKKNSRQLAEDVFRGVIKKYQVISNTPEPQAADAAQMGKSTLASRKHSPGQFRLDELAGLRRQLEIPLDELLDALRPLL